MLQHKENIGRMDERITFQEKIVGGNESNEDEEQGWENIDDNPTVWASKTEKLVSSGEEYRADKLTAFGNVVFVCRYRTDVSAMNRVICRGVPYNIIAPPLEIGRRRFLQVECESGGEFIGEIVITEGAFSDGFSDAFEI